MASATIEASQSLLQSETRVSRTYTETVTSGSTVGVVTGSATTNGSTETKLKKKRSSRRHKDEGKISVSKSSEKLHKKMKADEGEANPQCQKCARPVYAMERIKAEKRIWHKECFRCVQCNRQLTVETYESDHTTLYCKQHFKQLFEPKPVGEEDQPDSAPPKKHQMIICESNPIELPPDVVRASDKPDLGLEELAQLDVKSRFEVFERGPRRDEPPPPERGAPRERSAALLSKLAKFKAKGMDIGVSDEYLNGVPVEPSSSEPEDDDEADEDSVLKKSYKQTANREQPVSFCNMSEIVGKFETGRDETAERHRHRKQEIQNIRTRLFMGKQAKIKEMYEQSVMQSEQAITSADKIAKELELDSEKSRAIKQRFESGQVFNDENQPPRPTELDDPSLFNEANSIKQRFESGEVFGNHQPRTTKLDGPRDFSEASSIKQRFESGEVFGNYQPRTTKVDDPKEFSEASSIKQRFESGEVFGNHQPKTTKLDDPRDFSESSSIKQRFESGEVFGNRQPRTAKVEDPKGFSEANSIKQRFESGELFENHQPRTAKVEDPKGFSEGIGKKSRSIFLELDANAKNVPTSPLQEPPKRKEIPFIPKDVVRADDKVEDVQIQTADISDRFKFFETYRPERQHKEFRMTPPRQQPRAKSPSPEVYQEPGVARGGRGESGGDAGLAAERHTASRMIGVFRLMEENLARADQEQAGPKPLKRFTPPPPGAYTHESSSEEEYSSEEEEDSEEERRRLCSQALQRDEALKQAQQLARTKSFRERFEHWSENEPQRSPSGVVIERQEDDDGESQLETAKSLREKFENMKMQSSVTKNFATKVNRFV